MINMQTSVSVNDKKSFIRWFLNNYQLKKRESVWILNYLLNHEEILANVHFVRDAKFCPRGIIMTSYCSKETPFRFNKNHIVTTDADKSFHDIRLNQKEPLYIQLNFKNAYQNPIYAGVLEVNPYVPDEYSITETDRTLAKKILEKTIFDFKLKEIQKAIDRALDEKDQQKFSYLTNELKQLKETKILQPNSNIE